MQKDPKFTVIIPNYNGLKYMENCMAALRKQSYTSFIVLIVDNGSSDGSREYLEALEASSGGQELPLIKTILLDSNTGFSGAVNAGIAASDTEYVVLLNNDTEAEPDYLKELAAVFEADPEGRIFAVSPMMIQLYHKELLDDAGDGYNLFGWAFQRGVGQPVTTPKFTRGSSVFSACAGAAAYRRSILEEIAFREGNEVQYFDLMHFAYLEDIDVSFRARIHGYEIVYAPGSKVFHVGSGTSGSKYNSFKVRLAARNNVYLNYKNMPLLMLLVNLPGILLGVLVKLCFFKRIGFAKDYASGFGEALRTLGECKKHKTGFRLSRLGIYLKLELMMLADTFSYIQDVFVRHF